MKFINANVQRIPHPDPSDTMAVYRYLEKIGRTCYKSEDKITDESCLKFLQNIFKRKHWAMLEHYPFVIADHSGILHKALHTFNTISDKGVQSKLHFIKSNVVWLKDGEVACSFISGSATGFNYLYEALMASPVNTDDEDVYVYMLFMKRMHRQFPNIFADPVSIPERSKFHENVDDQRWELWSQDRIMKLDDPNADLHLYMTVRFICDRGVTHEIVRHRPSSYAQESTRYCNYGGSGCQFIIPEWFSDDARVMLANFDEEPFIVFNDKPLEPFTVAEWAWVQAMQYIENAYNKLIGEMWVPQQSRSVLPNSVKTEIVMTANIPEWGHFFNMRVPKSAHPQMREVSIPLYYLSREVYGDRLPNLDDEAEGTPVRVL